MALPGKETVLIAGAGIAGLGAAMALANAGRRILVLERDGLRPELDPEQSFDGWDRAGVAQLRHSHIFLGRLTSLLRRHHPLLLEELLAAGARLSPYEEMLPDALRRRYRPQADDGDLTLLNCRRATLEYVLRRHVEKLAGVELITRAKVMGVVASWSGERLCVQGLEYQRDGIRQTLVGDITIDASGRSSLFPNWLRDLGAVISEEKAPTGILYFTRHYRLRDGAQWPALNRFGLGGDLGYLRYGICPADNGCFSVTLAVPQREAQLRRLIRNEALFQAVCDNIPACAAWTDPQHALARGPVLLMGNLANVWRSFLKDGKAQLLDFFAVGDSATRTNPLYGRGCSAALLNAHVLREILAETDDPAQRAVLLEERTTALLRPFFESSIRQDRGTSQKVQDEPQRAGAIAALKRGLKRSLLEQGLQPAMQGDIHIARAIARGYHMMDPPIAWRRQPLLFARVLRMWLMPSAYKRSAGLYSKSSMPDRDTLLNWLRHVESIQDGAVTGTSFSGSASHGFVRNNPTRMEQGVARGTEP